MSGPIYFLIQPGGYRKMLERQGVIDILTYAHPGAVHELLADLDLPVAGHPGIPVPGGLIIGDDRQILGDTHVEPQGPFTTGLSPAEEERLHLLAEEAGEIVQACMKVLRHGYASQWPPHVGQTNRQKLTKELGDLCAAIDISLKAGDIRENEMEAAMDKKLAEVPQWLHHQ